MLISNESILVLIENKHNFLFFQHIFYSTQLKLFQLSNKSIHYAVIYYRVIRKSTHIPMHIISITLVNSKESAISSTQAA